MALNSKKSLCIVIKCHCSLMQQRSTLKSKAYRHSTSFHQGTSGKRCGGTIFCEVWISVSRHLHQSSSKRTFWVYSSTSWFEKPSTRNSKTSSGGRRGVKVFLHLSLVHIYLKNKIQNYKTFKNQIENYKTFKIHKKSEKFEKSSKNIVILSCFSWFDNIYGLDVVIQRMIRDFRCCSN